MVINSLLLPKKPFFFGGMPPNAFEKVRIPDFFNKMLHFFDICYK